MPEGYTHVRTANIALNYAKVPNYNEACFTAGANGPDTFFCYRVWSKKRVVNLPRIGADMHNRHCGEFLQGLIVNAKTDAQKGYAQGFLCHYALDSVVHPYIEFLTSKGQPYHEKAGHGYYEIALDSTLFKADYGTRTHFYNITCPKIIGKNLAEVSRQLKICFDHYFTKDIPVDAVADSFHHFYTLHRLFYSKFGIKKFLMGLAELLLFRKNGFITVHIMPA
ncbi:MAG: zinc dependent phospholipase C family protein, partial [Oscillospiraceae bacterium]